jgi:hypothetical protein
MSASPAELALTTDAIDQAATRQAPVVPSPPVLITEQQVLFDSAAARGLRPATTGGRFGDILHRLFAMPVDAPRAKAHTPRRYAYLEDALMSREMGRL